MTSVWHSLAVPRGSPTVIVYLVAAVVILGASACGGWSDDQWFKATLVNDTGQTVRLHDYCTGGTACRDHYVTNPVTVVRNGQSRPWDVMAC